MPAHLPYRSASCAALIAVVTLAACHQDGESPREPHADFEVGSAIDEVRHVVRPVPGDPGLWRALDPTYTAEHRGGTFTFVPHDPAAQALSGQRGLSWETTSIRFGDVELAADEPERRHHGTRVSRAWRSGVEEYYVHRADRVEQLWDIHTLPPTRTRSRALTITGRVDGVLVATTASGLHFGTERGPLLVAYSPATIFDARGRRIR